jgi:hypothetical protein
VDPSRTGPFHVDEAALLDPDEQRVDGALCDVGEALSPQPRRDLVAVRGPQGQDREDDALEDSFKHFSYLLAHGRLFLLPNVTYYRYIVTLNSGRASPQRTHPSKALHHRSSVA